MNIILLDKYINIFSNKNNITGSRNIIVGYIGVVGSRGGLVTSMDDSVFSITIV